MSDSRKGLLVFHDCKLKLEAAVGYLLDLVEPVLI